MEEVRIENYNKTFTYLKEFEEFDEARSVYLMYQYKSNHDIDYEKIVKEVVKEHKEGIIDPTRVVGKEERRKGNARKKIQ